MSNPTLTSITKEEREQIKKVMDRARKKQKEKRAYGKV